MRFRKRNSSEDKIYKQTYMKGKLEIVITPLWNVDGLGHNTIREDCRTWHMKYRTDRWTILSRDIPHDLYSVLTDLALALDEEVAKIIYEEMEHRFNELLCYIQRDSTLTWGLLVANVTQVRFPPIENFRAELSMIRWWNPNQRITPTTTAEAITRTRVLTADEYEELRQNGGLNSWEIYLIVN